MIKLLIATMQVSAILLVALGMVWLLRKQSASLRHAVIVIAMTCAAFVPALGYLVPAWQIPPIPFLIEVPVAGIHESTAGRLPQRVATNPAMQTVQSTEAELARPDFATRQSSQWRDALPSAIRAAYMVYVAGVAFFLLRLTIGLLRLRWIAAQSEPLRSSQWQRRVTAIAIAYRLRRTVKLLLSASPLLATWGIVHPQVLLPAGAENWPEERIRAVLLHELAHIRRNDWAIQLLAGVLRSIYWFNPLVWLAFARLRQESEQACDDTAIAQGEDQAEYAGQLLALARSLNETAQLPAAPAMALRSALRQRIAAVLDPATPHAPATARSLTAVAATLLVVTGAVAACDGMRSAGDDRTQPASLLTGGAPDPVKPSLAGPGTAAAINANSTAAVDRPLAKANAEHSPTPAADNNHAEPRSPQIIAASVLELVESALADESLAMLDEVQRPITGLHHLQRLTRAVAEDDGVNPAIQTASYVEIINALKNTATFASNVTSAPRGAQLPKQEIDRLAAALREKAEELAGATMPTPRVSSVNVSTPERRAAISALDLAQSTLRNTRFVGPRSVSWLGNELDTLALAAQSVLSDDGTNQGSFTAKLYALRGALLSISRNADNIARRPRASPDALGNATTLSKSVRLVMNQLATAMPQSRNPDDVMLDTVNSVTVLE